MRSRIVRYQLEALLEARHGLLELLQFEICLSQGSVRRFGRGMVPDFVFQRPHGLLGPAQLKQRMPQPLAYASPLRIDLTGLAEQFRRLLVVTTIGCDDTHVDQASGW